MRLNPVNPAHACERHPVDRTGTRKPSTVIVWRGDHYTHACTTHGQLAVALVHHSIAKGHR